MRICKQSKAARAQWSSWGLMLLSIFSDVRGGPGRCSRQAVTPVLPTLQTAYTPDIPVAQRYPGRMGRSWSTGLTAQRELRRVSTTGAGNRLEKVSQKAFAGPAACEPAWICRRRPPATSPATGTALGGFALGQGLLFGERGGCGTCQGTRLGWHGWAAWPVRGDLWVDQHPATCDPKAVDHTWREVNLGEDQHGAGRSGKIGSFRKWEGVARPLRRDGATRRMVDTGRLDRGLFSN
jgi:hypothetical protein